MRKIAVALSKGGVGKTTTAVHLAHGLAKRGHRVLLIDADTQGHGAGFLGVRSKLAPGHGLAAVIKRMLEEEELASDGALIRARDNLWLLAGGRGLATTRMEIDNMDAGREFAFSDALEPFEGKFDYVIIDTSPGWDTLTVNTLFYADEVLVPAALEAATMDSLSEFHHSLGRVNKVRSRISMPNIDFKYLVPTFLDGRVKKSREILGHYEEHFADKICHPIRYNVRISEAVGYGQTVFEYDPTSPGAEDYTKLTLHIENNGKDNG